MTKDFRSLCRSVVILLASASPVLAQSTAHTVTVHLDPQQTKIQWTLGSTLHTVHGTFQLKGGVITFNPATGEAQGEVLVDVASGESGDKARDGKMQKEVLESQKFPQAFFHPLKVSGALKGDGPQNVTVEGTFNIHGVDHPLSLPMQVQLHSTAADVTTSFKIPYVAWGMKDESRLMLRVDKQVDVSVSTHAAIEGLQ